MGALLKRLVASSAAYQASSVLSAAIGVVTLPIYTRHVGTATYVYADLILVAVILASIALTFGLSDALLRWWYEDEDEDRRAELARAVSGVVLTSTTVLAALALIFAGELSELLLDHRDATLMSLGIAGFWAYANLQVSYALLRAEHRHRAYLVASCANVLLTVALTLVLVVGLDQGARGLVLGNYGASAVVLAGLWIARPEHLGLPRVAQLGPLLRFGLPTVPADASVFALNVVDRTWLVHAQGAHAGSLFSASVKVATAVIVVVRGFQAAWPPLAYSIASDDEARRFYAVVASAYVAVTGLAVTAMTLLGRWIVRLLTAPDFHGAYAALPWLSLGWALYGLYLVFVVTAGRAKVTTRNFPAAAAGLAVNVALLALLVGPLGIRGAGIALCGAYLVMLVAIGVLTHRLFPVPFEWWRLARIVVVLAGVSVAGELLLDTGGAAAFFERLAVLAVAPLLLALVGAVTPAELARLRAALPRRR